MRPALALLLPCLFLAGCDDPFMIHQPKLPPFRSAAVGPAPVPADAVLWRSQPVEAPPLTLALIERGQARFRSFCTPCHSELGDGHGMIVQRGFSPPPSYHEARLRQAPTVHFYDVITHGYGAMYAFDYRVPPEDRWAIAAYIRALQRSTAGKLDDLSPEQRATLQREARR
ncbi:MAG: cytochrome c [Acetobacteraceae bacterium]|nr:cytochrome c [Acetobacteraceae bacterium]